MITETKPKYRKIAEDLKRDILGGKLSPGGFLPSQNDLTAHYGVALSTVRQAISHLEIEGYVRAEKGRGVFVQSPDSRTGTQSDTKNKTIGFAAIGTFSPYDPVEQMYLHGAASVLRPAEWDLSFGIFPLDDDFCKHFHTFLDKVHGVIVSQYYDKRVLEILKSRQVKAVLLGQPCSTEPLAEEFHKVQADAMFAGYLAGQSLALHGHKKVSLVCQLETGYFQEVQKGFLKACREYEISHYDTLTVSDRPAEREAARVLANLPQVTGIAVEGDMHACRAIQDFKALGVRVPEQKSVLAIGGLPRNILSEPALSRVYVDLSQMGQEAAALLLSETTAIIHKSIPSAFEKGKTLDRPA